MGPWAARRWDMKLDPVLVLRLSEVLTGVSREPYTKRRHGKAFGSIVADRMGRVGVFGQKLPLICRVGDDPASKVSLGLWQTIVSRGVQAARAGGRCAELISVR